MTDYTLGHKTSLNKFKMIEISFIASNHNGMKLEITAESWEVHRYMAIKQGAFRQLVNQIKHNIPNNVWEQSSIKREVHKDKCLC